MAKKRAFIEWDNYAMLETPRVFPPLALDKIMATYEEVVIILIFYKDTRHSDENDQVSPVLGSAR
jgi:hypothetical protein